MACVEPIPDFPVIYTEGDLKPVWTLRIPKRDFTSGSANVLVKQPDGNLITRSLALVSASAEVSVFSLTWIAGDIVAGWGQELWLQLDQDGTGFVTTLFAKLNVRAQPVDEVP